MLRRDWIKRDFEQHIIETIPTPTVSRNVEQEVTSSSHKLLFSGLQDGVNTNINSNINSLILHWRFLLCGTVR